MRNRLARPPADNRARPSAGDEETDGQRDPVDVRLAIVAVAIWFATLWGLANTSGRVGLAATVAFVAGLGFVLVGRRWPAVYPVALLCCAVALALGPLYFRLHAARDTPLATLAHEHTAVIAELTITSDPRPLAARGAAGSPRMVVDASLHAVSVAGSRSVIGGSVLVLGPLDQWRGLLPGQRLKVDAMLSPPLSDDLLTATLSVNVAPELIGRPPWWQRAAGRVRGGLQSASAGLGGQVSGLLPGLVDGDTSQLDPVLADRFRVAGLTHLVAVSGTNCSIMVGSVALIMGWLRASPRASVIVGAVVILVFVVVARPSPSVLRAAVMSATALAAIASGRPRSALPVLAAAVAALLLWQPALAVSTGFTLSVVATAALILVAPGWASSLHRKGVPVGIAEALAVAAAAHVVTAPIIAGISGRFSLVAIPANLLAEPVVAGATVLGVLTAAASVISMPLARLFAELAALPCRWLIEVADYFGSLTGAQLPWPSGMGGGLSLLAISAAILAVARHALARLLLSTALVVALLIQLPVRAIVQNWPATGWLIVACDVGQGDALALADGPHSAVVIDTGPDPVPVDRCLRQLHIERVDLLVLTHDHLDHVGGLDGVFAGRTVRRVLVSPLTESVSGNRIVNDLLARHHLTAETAQLGQQFTAGDVQVSVLGPAKVFRGTRSDPNNSSIVVRAVVGGHSILLPGDAEIEAQDALLASGVDLRSDILKVPHHGSAYSDPAFLAAVHAKLALVSVGRNNDYGHPSPLLIAEMARLGVPTYRTDLSGDIAVIADSRGQLTPVTHAHTAAAAYRVGADLSPARATIESCRAPPRSPP